MATLAIKGHSTRGNEVIEILEMLGGKNEQGHYGNNPNVAYYISHNNNTILCDCVPNIYPSSYKCVDYTLEEFLEKFPYKIGDKILYKTYGIYTKIKTMLWNVEKEQVFYRLGSNKLFVATADELKLCKEETIEADEHPNKDLKRLIRKAESYDKLVSKGLVSIERVCEWLNNEFSQNQDIDGHPNVESRSCVSVEELIQNFRKAMEAEG